MRLAYSAVPFALAIACTNSRPPAITGPTTRFAVDRFALPTVPGDGTALGSDLDGDGSIDNAFAAVTTALAAQMDLAPDVADLITDGVIASALELTTGDDGAIGIRYIAAGSDDPTQLRTTTLSDGTIATGGLEAGRIDLVLPGLVDADPIEVTLERTQMELAPDGDGFDIRIQGLANFSAFADAAAAALVQMIYANPRAHLFFAAQLDVDRDGVVSAAEAKQAVLFQALVEPDIGAQFSVGFAVHVMPCDAGSCAADSIVDHCHDRIVDGDETGVDCGGSCVACAAEVACSVDADCDSAACDHGHCGLPTCDDRVLDGFETGVDCGAGCSPCASGQPCALDADCASMSCDNGGTEIGTCT